MAHFAHVKDGFVDQVLVIDQQTLNSGLWGDPSEWVKTSYNTLNGVHLDHNGEASQQQEKALRGSFAGVGDVYDLVIDAFYSPNPPFPSWTIPEGKKWWVAPIPKPDPTSDLNVVVWSEEKLSWVEVGLRKPTIVGQ